jgi:cellulose synthase/poly-beta-1,6-N-acetylglucosamine synthase-like glycosyltransferase
MIAAAAVLWVSVACIVYTYFGYPLLLMLLAALHQLHSDWRLVAHGRTRRVAPAARLPALAVVVAAHNEERHIAERLHNLLAQDYPADLLTVYVGSDASDDRTVAIVRAMASPRVHLVEFTQRRGKTSVVNDLVAMTQQEIVVFTDANTYFQPDALSCLVRHFDQPDVGCVCGELRLVKGGGTGENLDHVYWRYERMLKFFESRIGALLGANGGVYALRRLDYKPIPGNAIVDDFWISMAVVEAGRRCVYDPEAVARETIPDRIDDEFRRRVRIGTGNYQAMVRFANMLDPRRGLVALAFFSHKFLRWVAPHCMVLALLCNLVLIARTGYAVMMALQLAFYGSAALGWWRSRSAAVPALLRVPLFFVSMNAGLLFGFVHYIQGHASAVWARSARGQEEAAP